MRHSKTQQALLQALSNALHGKPVGQQTDDVLDEARQQTVLTLICSSAQAYPSIATNVQIMWEQQELAKTLQGIPYLVLKGACAAIYYPEPMRRTLGDIDILVPPDCFSDAYCALKKADYKTSDPLEGDDRHAHFSRNGILVELHRRYATLQTKDQERLLDDWLYKAEPVEGKIGKYTFPMPEDQLNGLVLLAHINQHLEDGLGLRHLVDWCMFVQHSLPDEQWPAFKEKTDQLGLTKLALVIARFGQVYLDLYKDVIWCSEIRTETIDLLLDYIFECGNFGYKDAINNTIVMVMSHGRGLKGFFKNLQNRGVANWRMLKRAPFLKPFAWLYQLYRYTRLGLRYSGLKNFRRNAAASRQRNKLMDELGATRLAIK